MYLGMAIGTSVLAGVLWVITAIVLYFYRLNKKAYNQIVEEIRERKAKG